MRFISYFVTFVISLMLLACGGGGGSAGVPVGASTALTTTATSNLSMVSGGSQNYLVSGGKEPYVASSSNASVAKAAMSGSQLSIASLSPGVASVEIRDAAGTLITVSLTVTDGRSSITLFTTAPSSIIISNGASRTFAIGGGLAPYTATSSDATIVSTAVLGSTLNLVGLQGGSTTVQVRDAAGSTVSINVKVGSSNNFFTTAPGTLTIAAGSSASFAVTGGSQSYLASSSNTSVANASVGGGTLTISGVSAGAVSVTVSDSTGATSVVAVTVIGGVAVNVARVDVTTSTNTLQSAGSEATITATVKNSGNLGLAGQNIVFTASSGTLQNPTAQTDASGSASVKLTAGSDKSVRDITVTATVGTVSGSVVVPVTGTRLSIAGSGTLQAAGAATTYSVRAVDSSGNPVSGVSLIISSTLGNPLSLSTVVTDVSGSASFSYTPTTPGADTLKVVGLGTEATTSVVVSAVNFVVASPAANSTIAIGTLQPIKVRYQELGVGVPGKVVTFSSTRGVITPTTTATTDILGEATINLSSTTAGFADVVAQIAGTGSVSLPVQFVATVPATVTVQSNPGAVLPNVTGNTNQSSIEAVVRDANGNPVANRQVNFTIISDLSNGSLSTGNAMTDANGRAQVQFIAGANSTPSNGVSIQAAVSSSTISSITTLTVNGNALFITLGFGNEISNLDPTTYSKNFTVYVTDANGVAVGNQLVTLAAIPLTYSKGRFTTNIDGDWVFAAGSPTATCLNEDVNRNGILSAGEDFNGNGQLTPGNIVVVSPGTVTTDATGHALFALQYGEQFAPWVNLEITARAVVSGTESRQSITFNLVGLVSDFSANGGPPAGVVSPFGSLTSCADAL